jgi:phosphoribosyl 1,2-cyclic phosphate phosphodiesterase
MVGHLTFLGTGTSMGVPTLGCNCAVCTSRDPHDKRLRPSVVVRWSEEGDAASTPIQERVVVIDTGPDFREQALRNAHADHIFGLDDLRPLSFKAFRAGGPIPLYATEETRETLERIYDYTFSPQATYPNRARVELKTPTEKTDVHGVEFLQVPLLHGAMKIVGYRFGNAAYLTDVSDIPEESFSLLTGLEHVVLSALRHKPHPNHATVEQALSWSRRIGARYTWLTHIAHELGHEQTNQTLPHGVALAYDGLTVPVTL